MRSARILLTGIALAQLAGCGSGEVIEDHYYSLVLAADSAAAPASEADALLVVGPVQLPDYLEGRSLTMQTGQNRVHAAAHHFWAEPLEDAIGKVLTRDLVTYTDGIDVRREAGRWTPEGTCRVRLEFDAFHPTHRSRAVAAGRYWIVTKDASSQHEFDISRTLTIDGYAHAVDVLRGTLEALAQKIAGSIAATGSCEPPPPEESVKE